MGIQEAADLLGVSKKKIWKAVTEGDLEAVKVKKGKAWRYEIEPNAVEAYRQIMDEPKGWEAVSSHSGDVAETFPQHEETAGNDLEPTGNAEKQDGNASDSPPVELYIEMLDRLQRAERRAIELELQLKQSQRLLTEHAESLIEKTTLTKEAETKEALLAKRVEELENVNAQLEEEKKRSWWSKIWSKKRASSSQSQSA